MLRYKAREYWDRRYRRLGFTRGAGNKRRSILDNLDDYERDWEKLCPWLPEGPLDCLEVGPGSGYYTERLADQYEVTGIEVSEVAARRLQGLGFRVYRYDICDFYIPASFDLILVIEVGQHIVTRERFERAMENLARSRAEDGVILIGALTDGRSWRTNRHVHQWTGRDVEEATGLPGERLCDFRTGGLWRFPSSQG